MRIFTTRGEPTTVRVRPLVPADRRTRGTRDRELGETLVVTPERDQPCSPAALLLAINDDPLRTLALMVWGVGIDWATDTLGMDRFPDGEHLEAVVALDIARRALDEQAHRVATLEELATTLVGAAGQVDGEDLVRHLAQMDGLLESLTVGADYDLIEDRLWAVYESIDLAAIAAIELVRLAEFGYLVSVCRHCDRPFFPAERSDERYCRNPAPGDAHGRSCQALGPQARYSQELDPYIAAYRATYSKLYNRARRRDLGTEILADWREVARELVDEARASGMNIEDLQYQLEAAAPQELGGQRG